jgi:hypothetical protein
MQKTFTEQGVLAAEGSRIRALERAQDQSGADWSGTQGGPAVNTQN